ncbi:ferrous iron transport protein B [Paenimyroides tangerinum]|uniref:Ferrous iron transport protein B n=1 Tax=Paenimyroides tangerinum TaxID=2488728 RepID=A0A3P3WF40_9FLAO|nr:ferrous iron transport protein B [Paenimyroides tangerinum]RRJ92259.1 ferrous iron transport protein B [Paenimyroides tangerinum]
MKNTIKVALVGNPNVGKTSVFNALTGLNQRVGNYPGITVERKVGFCKIGNETTAQIVDLPGTYSINPSSKDEEVALKALFDSKNNDFPDVVVVVAEVENLKRNLLLFSQIKDLGFPVVLAINMADRMELKGITIDISELEKQLDTKIALISVRKNQGINELKQLILNYQTFSTQSFLDLKKVDEPHFELMEKLYPNQNPYKVWLHHSQQIPFEGISTVLGSNYTPKTESEIKRIQQRETIKRYQLIGEILKKTYVIDASKATDLRAKLDRIFTHKVFGYVIFFAIMLLVFQAIFEWSAIPMDFIDGSFGSLSEWAKSVLPEGKLAELISDGIIPGIGGVVIFIPQIAILFLFIALLEESGYMSRVVFLMDKIMRPFGLSGKSVVPLISGTACSIPAIMSARNIENSKERLITMLVTPFSTCAARIPVYVIIIALVIPDETVFGIFSLQALTMAGMYFLGFFVALISAFVMKRFINANEKSFFIIEMPSYKLPLFQNVFYTVWEKTKEFVVGAGKIILALSIVLWFLGTHGPSDTFGQAETIITEKHINDNLTEEELADEIAGYQLETSYIGKIGHTIQPVFAPLGYDWKISIAVLTSFAAREVFVGNLATLYNIGSSGEDEEKIIGKMRAQVREDGSPMFTLGTGVSLLLFYAFAMQCISTIAITRKETNSWKWTFVQVVFMTALAYFSAMLAYQIL